MTLVSGAGSDWGALRAGRKSQAVCSLAVVGDVECGRRCLISNAVVQSQQVCYLPVCKITNRRKQSIGRRMDKGSSP